MFRLDQTKIFWDEAIGKGASGEVYPYGKTLTDNKWVIKYINKANLGEFTEVIQEVILGFNLDHPHVLPIRGFYVEEKKEKSGKRSIDGYIKLQRMKSSLDQIIRDHAKSKVPIPENQIIKWFYGLVCGLEYLHSKRIAHMDVNPNNILLDEQNNVKLTDIGIAKFAPEGETLLPASLAGGTPGYWAPEVQMEEQLNKKDLYLSDVWSLGKTIMKLCLPQSKEIRILQPKQETESEIERKLSEIEGKYSKVLVGILRGLLKYNKHERPAMEAVKRYLQENYSTVLGLKDSKVEVKSEEQKFEERGDVNQKIVKKEEELNNALKESNQRMEKFLEEANQRIQELEKRLSDDARTFQIKESSLNKKIQFLTQDNEKLQQIVSQIKEKNSNKTNIESIDSERKQELLIKPANLSLLKSYLEGKWKKISIIIIENGLNIKPAQPSELSNREPAEFMEDLNNTLQSRKEGLQTLEMDLGSCQRIDDEGVKAIASQIRNNLKTLQRLSLKFDRCTEISNQGLKALASQIGTNLKSLQRLSLDFTSCHYITDEGFKALVSEIATNLKSLLQLNLEFYRCKISKETILSAKDTMKSVPQLQITSNYT